MATAKEPGPEPFALEDVVEEIRAMRDVCDEHLLGLRQMLPWQKPFKPEELERRKKVYAVAIQLLQDQIIQHRIVIE